MFGCVLTALGGFLVTVDRIEEDRVVVEWCDRTTSDLPAALFPADLREGAVIAVSFHPAVSASLPLPGPGLVGADLHPAARRDEAPSDSRGPSRTEIHP